MTNVAISELKKLNACNGEIQKLLLLKNGHFGELLRICRCCCGVGNGLNEYSDIYKAGSGQPYNKDDL